MTKARLSRGRSVVLRDGRAAHIRPLGPADADALLAALANADSYDLRRRFLGTPPPARLLLDQLAKADGVNDLALGAFAPGGRLVAVAQFNRITDSSVAEIAVEVGKDWQDDGLATALVEALASEAVAVGIATFRAVYYADNSSVALLLRNCPAPVATTYSDGQGHSDIDLTQLRPSD
jgi:RimJ/RimL family protein N-acetyltransferase